MLRQGEGKPLLLLHGILGGERMWRGVMATLAAQHEVIAAGALGHYNGTVPSQRPVRLADVVDDAERLLDRLGWEQAHLAGNSMGGWVALELARRGRALSVCALSPAGAWERDWEDRQRLSKTLRRLQRDTRRSRRVLPALARSGRFRGWALRDSAVHGERVSPDGLLELADDTIACTVAEDLLASPEQLDPLDPLPCPITLAWSGEDRMFAVERYGARARELVPAARFVVLEGVGHVPMLDDPDLVARTILASTAGVG